VPDLALETKCARLQVKTILAAVRKKPDPARCIMVSATMTKAVRKIVGRCAIACQFSWQACLFARDFAQDQAPGTPNRW
jgi:hypothetical protein